jgi:hypothetical protein
MFFFNRSAVKVYFRFSGINSIPVPLSIIFGGHGPDSQPVFSFRTEKVFPEVHSSNCTDGRCNECLGHILLNELKRWASEISSMGHLL